MRYFKDLLEEQEGVREVRESISPNEWKIFIDSRPWVKISKWIANRLSNARDELEFLGKEDDASLADFAFIQGVCYALRIFATFPEVAMTIDELDEEETNDEQE